MKFHNYYSYSLITTGTIHNLFHLSDLVSPLPPGAEKVILEMQSFSVFGSSVYDFYTGFSFLMGFMFIFLGWMNLKITNPKPFYTINLSVCITTLFFGIGFFFFIPIILFSISTALLLLSKRHFSSESL